MDSMYRTMLNSVFFGLLPHKEKQREPYPSETGDSFHILMCSREETMGLLMAPRPVDPAGLADVMKETYLSSWHPKKREEELAYRFRKSVVEAVRFKDGREYPLCPQCRSTLEWEYQSFCDRCGQKLGWYGFEEVIARSVYEEPR
ncbi:MAG: hypothetical protein ACI3W6_03670 [Clostridia bacterium]